tara:strand:- start:414 stop:638 length:225 start_codon:yes stop_codon:yes gene_type:complete
MPLQFIPQSDDPFLTTEAAMSLAKFGHINFLLSQLNDNLFADNAAAIAGGLQPGDLYRSNAGATEGCVMVVFTP